MAVICLTKWQYFRQQLCRTGERRLMVLAGNQDWAIKQAQWLSAQEKTLWLGEKGAVNANNHIYLPINKFQTALGKEYTSVVFNAFSGLHPDAFGAVSGTLVAGGVMLLLCPPLTEWPNYADPDLVRYVAQDQLAAELDSPFLHRFIRLLQVDNAVIMWPQGTSFPTLTTPFSGHWQQQPDHNGCLNIQQRHALANLLYCARTRTTMVLTADRGRGKSSLLGLAAHRLLQSGLTVLLTAPNQDAPTQVLQHCAHPLRFMAPDALLAEQPHADIVLIDEAAVIPVPILLTLAERYCCIFASTEHGYEGTGLGFQLKFQPSLTILSPHWRKVHVSTPARWSHHDPLEPLIFTLLALNAEPIQPKPLQTQRKAMVIHSPNHRWITRQTLLDDEPLLQQIFGLLTLAHYQTRPSDLRHLLDAPNLLLVATFLEELPIAVALLIQEGPLTAELSQGVWRGQRRPRGHLLPQSLAFHGGFIQATQFTYYRVMRIVVHPHCQQQGIGSQLLGWLQDNIAQQTISCDFLGTSFGASPSLLTFWQNNDFRAVRLGQSRDGVSGLQAIMMLWPCSAAAAQTALRWQGQFNANLQAYCNNDLPTALTAIYPNLLLTPSVIDKQQDALIAHDFAFYHRDLYSDQPALTRFIEDHKPYKELTIDQQRLLHSLICPNASLNLVIKQHNFPGQKAAISQLRNIMQHYFKVPSEP